MKGFLLLMEDIEKEGSFLAKEQLLNEAINTFPEAETFFRIAFNDTVYGCDEKSFYKAFNLDINDYNKQFGSFSDYIFFARKNEQGEATITYLESWAQKIAFSSGIRQIDDIALFIDGLDALHAKWFSRAILKDLRCGVQLKTINKAFKACNLKEIEKHAVQLCGKLDIYDIEEVKKRIKFPCVMEIKYDGTRIQAEVFNGKCKLTSRHGKDKTEQYPEIAKELEKVFQEQHVILDGEIIAGNFQELSTRMHRKAENLNEVSKIVFVVFDLLMDEKLDYRYRWDNLRELADYFEESQLITLAEHYDAGNIDDLQYFYEEANKRKEEGIIIKLLDKPYDRGSRKNMYKVKKVYDADLLCVAWNTGDGKKAGKVASLDLIDKSTKIKCSVGSGIDDNMSEYLSNHTQDIIGKIIEIQYNEITETGSIRFPRFISIREDKTEPDDLSKVELRQ